jgi:hypothetical protein
MKKSDITTPLVNILRDHNQLSFMIEQLKEFMLIRPSGVSSIKWHKQKLGKQKYCWKGFIKHWVWETDTWRVYVNKEGSSFEVLESLNGDQAIEAWKDYYSKVKQ